jgi:DNA-binding beta-propeller fold protein YncE
MNFSRIYLFGLILLVSFTACKQTTQEPPLPSTQADFSFQGTNNFYPPCTVGFTDQSLLAQSYQWDFGNGQSSNEQNPTVVYETFGDFTAKLTVSPLHDVYYNNLVREELITIRDPDELPKKTLYFTDRDSYNVKYVRLDGKPLVIKEFEHTGLSKPYGCVIDTVNAKVLVGDYSLGVIYRYDLDGSNLETILDNAVDPNLDYPLGIEIINGLLYWCREGGIYRSNLDGTGSEPFLELTTSSPPEMPVDLTYDPVNDKIYFTNDKYDYSGGVYVVNADGTGLTGIVSGTDGGATVVDYVNGRLFYADWLQGMCMNNLDGTNEVVINTDLLENFCWGMDIDIEGGFVYWSNKADGIIVRANLDGSNQTDWITGQYPHAIAIDKPR